MLHSKGMTFFAFLCLLALGLSQIMGDPELIYDPSSSLSIDKASLSSIKSIESKKAHQSIVVLDGDTLIYKKGSQRYRIRFAFIDAPEKDQKFNAGIWSTNELKALIKNKKLKFKICDEDRYKRKLAFIYILENQKEILLQQLMIEKGLAYVGKIYRDECYFKNKFLRKKLRRLQRIAYKNKIGIHQYKGLKRPWKYRYLKRKKRLSP